MTRDDLKIMALVHERTGEDLRDLAHKALRSGNPDQRDLDQYVRLNEMADREFSLSRAFRDLAKEQE